ncbi:hypothetical protein [Streptomyces sp. JJ36]|uniref:hypothetical protein n=1 Tax=Streptomyces sp. JJ36 TaxID=2736645 RepID=UPI001F339F90|nr:hypothetical protein [Streptomyces sp. JJ36]
MAVALASFALTGYAGVRLLGGDDPLGVVLWFAGAAVLHDLVLLPLYASADRLLQALPPRRRAGAAPVWLNHVRVPVLVSGLLLLVWYPLVLMRAERYERYTTLSDDGYPVRWGLLTAGLFAASAVLLAVRLLRARRTGRGDGEGPGGDGRTEGAGPQRPGPPG